MRALYIVCAALALHPLFGSKDCPTMLRTPEETRVFGEMRVRAIRGWDKLLTWALAPKNLRYDLAKPPLMREFASSDEEFKAFVTNYGYFSIHHPIVGIVTQESRDIQVTSCLLQGLASAIEDPLQLQFSRDEILAKVMAYRPLQKGMQIDLGSVVYVVDVVIDLWKGMPAFGLVPKNEGEPPILLFRGTDLNLASERGWASVFSDLDTQGPGYSTFLRARRKIHSWLKKVEKTPARLVGFSLGGVFVLYTLIHEYPLISKQHLSTAFNPPGVPMEALEKWRQIPEKQRPLYHLYVNRGDYVSQIGYLLPDTWEAFLPKPMGVIESHVTLISAKPRFTLAKLAVHPL